MQLLPRTGFGAQAALFFDSVRPVKSCSHVYVYVFDDLAEFWIWRYGLEGRGAR